MTFLFTDIEGSTRLLSRLGDEYHRLLDIHNALMRGAITAGEGVEVRTEGDSFFAVFSAAPGAVGAAVRAQRALAETVFPGGADVRVRMGIHTGLGTLGGDDYVGIDVHRAARIASVGSGGQVLISAASAGLVEGALPDGVRLRDLGVHTLKDLDDPERIYQLTIDGLVSEFAPLATLEAVRHNLPTHLTSFVGRQVELIEATGLLGASRLLTLTGPGGTGKTRLAVHLAAAVADEFADGVYLVQLAPISNEDLVASQILGTLPGHLTEAGTAPEDNLHEYLTGRNLLLVLDNFEHVIGAAPLVARILRASPGIKVLATSRVPLRLAGEQELPVPPLAVPNPDHLPPLGTLQETEAVALFVDRARAVRPSFGLDDDSAQAIAELTNHLDGLPLAIELAASRVRTLSPREILGNLGPTMLSGGPRDSPERHQTLENTIAWSYDLLPGPCQVLFDRFSVFANGAALEQVETVCGEHLGVAVLDAVELLIEHSLLRQSAEFAGTRFRMLETIRYFAGARLEARGEESLIRARHAHAYAALAAEAEPNLTGSDRVRWLDRLSAEHDNLLAAHVWAVDHGETDMAYGMAASLWRFFHMRGHLFSARKLLDDVLGLSGGSPRGRSRALEAAGGVAYWSGDMRSAYAHYQEALELLRPLGEQREIAHALYNVGFVGGYAFDFEQGRELLNEALAMFEELGDRAGVATATWGLGDAWTASGHFEEARGCFDRAIADFEELDDSFGLGWALYTQAEVLIRLGELDQARTYLERGLRLFEHGDLSAIVLYLAAFAALEMAVGDTERGLRLAGAMVEIREDTGTDLVTVGIAPLPGLDYAMLETLEGRPAEIFDEGRGLSASEAVALALNRTG